MKKIIIGVVALLVIAAAAFGGVYVYSMNQDEKEHVIEEAYFELGEVFVNLDDKDTKRYVKLNLTLSFDKENEDLGLEIEEKKIVLRDTAIFYLKACVADDFSAANEEVLKSELITAQNKNLVNGTLVDIYINDIMVQ